MNMNRSGFMKLSGMGWSWSRDSQVPVADEPSDSCHQAKVWEAPISQQERRRLLGAVTANPGRV